MPQKMRDFRKTWIWSVNLLLFFVIICCTQRYSAQEDIVDYLAVDYLYGTVEWDSMRGPHYRIDLNTGELLHCSASEAQIISFAYVDGIVTVEVYSNEIPENMIYVLDLANATVQREKDYITDGLVDRTLNVLDFDTEYGPNYKLDLETGVIYHCSSDDLYPDQPKAQVLSYEKNGEIVTVTVYSAELPMEQTYIIDLTSLKQAEPEVIESYIVYTDGNIEFDSTRGPWYRVDYKNKQVVGCTSEGAKIIACEEKKNILTLTVYSEELPVPATYTFDLKQNVMDPTEDGMGWGEFDGKDMVEYFNILEYDNSLEFDSQYGPYYKIDLMTGEILYCTSDQLYPNEPKAKMIHCSSYGNHITVTVYSAELPYEMTYIFNIKNHKQVCGVADYDKKSSDKEISNIINKIIKGNYEGSAVDKETAKKIQKAHKENKTIVTMVETSCVDKTKVDDDTKNKVDKNNEDQGYESVQYLEISIVVYADGEEIGRITELENAIDFTLEISDEVQDDDKEFYVVRVHNDEVDVLDAEENGENNMTFETDRFSTYVLVYKSTNTGQTPDSGSTDSGDATDSEQPDEDVSEEPEDSEPSGSTEIIVDTEEITTEEATTEEVMTEDVTTEEAETDISDKDNEDISSEEETPSSNLWVVVLAIVILLITVAVVVYLLVKKFCVN